MVDFGQRELAAFLLSKVYFDEMAPADGDRPPLLLAIKGGLWSKVGSAAFFYDCL